MQSRSTERRLVAALGRLVPDGSQPALFIGDLLKEGPVTEPGEQRFVADGHSALFALLGAIWLLVAIGVDAGVDSLWGLEVARRAGGVLFAPAIFLMMLASVVQVAKFGGRFEGVQPVVGRFSWVACVAVPAAVLIIFGIG
jgi:hypothetical protein